MSVRKLLQDIVKGYGYEWLNPDTGRRETAPKERQSLLVRRVMDILEDSDPAAHPEAVIFSDGKEVWPAGRAPDRFVRYYIADRRYPREPVAYLHTLHMEFEQTDDRLTFTPDNPFGKPGRDYDPTYQVTTQPLYTLE